MKGHAGRHHNDCAVQGAAMASAAAASSVLGATAAAAAAAASELRPRGVVVATAAAAGGLGGFLLWQAWPGRRDPLATAMRVVDAVHAKQPRRPEDALTEQDYCVEVEQWVFKLCGGQDFVSPALRLAARSQHLERHVIPRSKFPEGRQGYLNWRTAVKRRQKERLLAILRFSGVDRSVVERASRLVGKDVPMAEDPEMQTLEDATCLTFLANELDHFQKDKDDAKLVDIFQKTWKKMSPKAHDCALGLDFTPRLLGCLVEAIAMAMGLEANSQPMVAPRLPSATVEWLRTSWEKVPQDTFGKDFFDRLYAEDPSLREVFANEVARPANVTKAIQMFLDQLEFELVPRLERMVHAIAALSRRFGKLRMAHMAPIKRALVRTVVAAAGTSKEKSTTNRAWEAFFYSMAAVAAPYLVVADNLSELADATAATLPTPGGGPQAGAIAAQGIALLEMSLGITALTQGCNAIPEEMAAKLYEARGWLLSSVRDDVNAYCGLLSSVYGRGLGGREAPDETASEAEYKRWLRRATEVPLRVAEVSTGAAIACLPCKRLIKYSLKGDWIAGVKLLRTAVEISTKNVAINLQDGGRVAMDIDTRLSRLRDTEPPWEDLCDI